MRVHADHARFRILGIGILFRRRHLGATSQMTRLRGGLDFGPPFVYLGSLYEDEPLAAAWAVIGVALWIAALSVEPKPFGNLRRSTVVTQRACGSLAGWRARSGNAAGQAVS